MLRLHSTLARLSYIRQNQLSFSLPVYLSRQQKCIRFMQCHAEQEGNRHPQPKPALPNKSQDLAGEKKVVGKELQGKWQKNIAQGALEEARLITWPSSKKALMDTMLVLGIVVASGGLLFGLNVLLAEISDFWYHISR